MPEVMPHTARHTAIIGAMGGCAIVWHVSGLFGVAMGTLERYHAHYHPDYVKTAVNVAHKMGNDKCPTGTSTLCVTPAYLRCRSGRRHRKANSVSHF
ncbi:hypothetical protein FIU86_18700 [Roseovarius sp. THAF9]|nr:hypothetical protein FIU86_18700 [Roseovarius sp. THAF9]